MTDRAPKLQKVLAQAGYGSRRSCERIIREGRVTINGERAELGVRADPATDQISIDGAPLASPEPLTYVMLHKPTGVLSSSISQGGWPTALGLLSVPVRVFPVGRLDLDSEGLMLFTNDGALAQALTHPSFGHEKEYRVLLDRLPDQDQLRAWRGGVTIGELGQTAPATVWIEEPWLGVILRQGMKRQIRETARVLGLKVNRLIRIRIAELQLGDLAPGKWRYLSEAEIEALRGKSVEVR